MEETVINFAPSLSPTPSLSLYSYHKTFSSPLVSRGGVQVVSCTTLTSINRVLPFLAGKTHLFTTLAAHSRETADHDDI